MPEERSKALSSSPGSYAETGVLALGSHQERHGILPEDTDAKLTSYLTLQACLKTGAKFLGVILSSYELPGIETGIHQPADQVLQEIRRRLAEASRTLGIKRVVIVNAHGGNKPLARRLREMEKSSGIRLLWDSSLVRGPHAGTEEFSMACALGVADPGSITEHADFLKHPEVGFVGLEEALKRYGWARRLAGEARKNLRADPELGRRLLEETVQNICAKIRSG